MARTFGANNTDVVTCATTPSMTTVATILYWFKGHSATSTFPRVLDAGARIDALVQASTGNIRFERNWTGAFAQWEVTAANHGMTMADWNHVAWVYDGSLTTNDPTCYVNGVAKTVTELTAPSGTIDNATATIKIGNRAAGDRSYGGTLAYVALCAVALTQGEVLHHMRMGMAVEGAIASLPLWGDTTEPDLSGSLRNGTVTGATVATGPPIAPPLVFRSASSGAAVRTGTLAATIGGVTLSAAGALAIGGSAAPTIGNLTLSGAGALAVQGSATPTIDNLTLTSAGALAITGAAAPAIANLTLAAAGDGSTHGALVATIGEVTLAAAGVLAIQGVGTPAIGEIVLASTATLAIRGVGAMTIAPITLASGAEALVLRPATISGPALMGLLYGPGGGGVALGPGIQGSMVGPHTLGGVILSPGATGTIGV